MSVQYVGHFLLLFELFWMLIKGTDRHCPLASSQLALCFWKRHVDFSASVFRSTLSCSNTQVLFGQIVHQAVQFTEEITVLLYFQLFGFLVYRRFKQFICVFFCRSDINYIVCLCSCLWCPVPRSVEYPSWDWRESRDFDELNHILQESKKLGKALESLSRSEWLQHSRVHAYTILWYILTYRTNV